jgi:hypothetical protein
MPDVEDDRTGTATTGRDDPPRRVLTNARLTGTLGAFLLVVFAAEGLTIVAGVRATLPTHIFIGMLAIPPVALKLVTTGYRFVRYYVGDAAYVDRGAPPWILRVVGPIVALSTLALIGTGVADAYHYPTRQLSGFAHKASFVLWFGVMTIHVVGHLGETRRLSLTDWSDRSGDRLLRIGAVVATLALGLVLGAWSRGWTLPG